jgi:hypothetical protein
MTVGRIVCSLYHLGTITTIQNTTFALLNGQSVSRSSYPTLSTLWPSGAYTSTSTNIHLPQTNTLYLRGANFGGSGDPDSSVRAALSGTQPSGVSVGSYQISNVKQHAHASGSASADLTSNSQFTTDTSRSKTDAATTTVSTISSSVAGTRPIQFNAAGVDFDVDNTKVYFYIALN